MNPTPRDYERVGQWLDGEPVQLTPAQRALAETIAADARKVGQALDAPPPPGVLHRVNARLKAAGPAAGRWAWLRWVSAAAAAAVLVGAALLPRTAPPPQAAPEPSQYVEHFLQVPAGELDARAQLLSEELAEIDYEVRLASNGEWPVELARSGLEAELGELMLDDADLTDESDWEALEGSW